MEIMWELQKIKKAHRPVDYKKLKEHELSYMSANMTRREQNKEDMLKNLRGLENSYKISFKSKVHDSVEKAYIDKRYFVKKRFDETIQKKTTSRNYSDKIKEINLLSTDDANLAKSLEKKYVKEGPESKNWFYGRFGKKVWRDECKRNLAANYMTNRRKLGDNYMEENKNKALRGSELNRSIEVKRQEDKKQKE